LPQHPSFDAPAGLPPDLPRRIHFAGIGGAGMSGLALALHEAGLLISGSDRERTPVVEELLEAGIPVRFDQGGLPEPCELVVRTAAMSPDHPEIAAALSRGLPIIKRAELLGRLCATEIAVAVAGTHGKTTICAMAARLLSVLLPGAGWFVGGRLAGLPAARLGAGRLRLCEADEFDRSFLQLSPTHLVLGGVDWDHVDIYPQRETMHAAFDELAGRLRGPAPLIQQLAPSALAGEGYLPACVRQGLRRRLTVGEDPQADLRVMARGGPGNAFDLLSRVPAGAGGGPFRIAVRLGLPGAHNRLNAATALAWLLCGEWGGSIEPEAAAEALRDFAGLERRFQLVAVSGARRLYDDYAHHPSEIAAFIRGARELGDGPLTVIHQPHTYSRVRAFAAETGEALSAADRVIVWPVFAARETPVDGLSHLDLLPHIRGAEVHAAASSAELRALLAGRLASDEILATVGAGDLYKQHGLLKELLEHS
jgi:UDP-N-acetylmuramate--alanine ligase